jgi:hypothetical protein
VRRPYLCLQQAPFISPAYYTDASYQFVLIYSCLNTDSGRDYSAALASIDTVQNKIAFIDRKMDAEYYYALRARCLPSDNGRDYSTTLNQCQTVDSFTDDLQTDIYQTVNDTAIVTQSVTVTYKVNRFITGLVCAHTDIHSSYTLGMH